MTVKPLGKEKFKKLDLDKAAKILAQAALEGDTKTAAAWNITTRTIQNYRKRLKDDDELSEKFVKIRSTLDTEWTHTIAPALRKAVKYLEEAFEKGSRVDPRMVTALTEAAKMLSEVDLTSKVINVNYSEQDRQNYKEFGEVVKELESATSPNSLN